MRNLKKVLSTLLAVAMLMSLVVFNASANTTFTDDANIAHTEAVDMNVALKIINGYEDNTFRPEGNITRGEMCKMIAVLMHGGLDPVLGTKPYDASFTDIRGHWAEKYIEYCVAEGIVAGMGDGTFQPDGNVTGTQAAKMLLVALGFRADVEQFNTSNWATRINVCAAGRHLYEDVTATDPNAPLSRDDAAQMIWNALRAFEVEYNNEWYMTEAGNMATKLTARDRTQAGGATGTTAFISLLEDKYECSIFTVMLGETIWSKGDKVFKYDVVVGEDNDGNDIERTFQSTTDYSEFFAMNVKIVVKKDGRSVLGMIPDNSRVLAEAPFGLFEGVAGESAIKVDDVKYKVDSGCITVAGETLDLDAYAQNVLDEVTLDNIFGVDADLTAADVAWTVKLIDLDGNGRVNHAVFVPFNFAKVNSINSTTVTLTRGAIDADMGIAGSKTLADIKYYDGMAKGDYVVIYAAANNPYDTEVFEEMETVTGEVTRTVGTIAELVANDDGVTWYMDGTGYDVHPLANSSMGEVLLTNEYTFHVMNGYVFAKVLGASNYTMDDVLFVAQYVNGGALQNDRAKVYFAKDGSKATISVAEIYMTGDKDEDVAGSVGDGGADAEYLMFTFTEKSGSYKLVKIDEDNQVGCDTYDDAPAAVKDDGITASTSKTPGTLNKLSIADDAVIFMIGEDEDGDATFKVLKGKDAKDLVDPFGIDQTVAQNDPQEGTIELLSNTVSNRNVVKVAVVMTEDQDIPSFGTSSYGYVVSGSGWSMVDGTKHASYKIYDASGKVRMVYEETAATPSKGDIISFTDTGSNNVIEDVEVLPDDNTLNAGFAANLGLVGDTTVQFSFGTKDDPTDLYANSNGNTLYTFNDDTVYLVVDSDGIVGEYVGDEDALADLIARTDTDNNTEWVMNCYFYANSDNVLKLVVFDVNGEWIP